LSLSFWFSISIFSSIFISIEKYICPSTML
jgi:hypothetical protein